MARTLLFLLGGSEGTLDLVAEEFVPAAGGRDSSIVLALMGGQGWEDHVPEYTEPWARQGANRHHVIVPGDNGTLDVALASARLREATGILIGGGHTPTYHRLYATEPIRSVIRQQYQKGVPVAGLSAGALIAPDICAMRPSRDATDQPLAIVEGLGLVSDLIVGVHFAERQTLPTVLEAMSRTQTHHGLGIDATACAVLENGRLKRVLGRSVYEITMTDFKTKAHKIAEARQGC